MIGRALNGRYELVEILGVGGMATVWRAVDRQLGRQVAVKVLNGGLADDPRFADRFGQEAQHAAMLVHPRVAMVFDSGVDQGSPYIVMELVQGRPLSRLIAEAGRLPVERAVGVAAAVCEALAAAHAQGLVHRDIKPGNIMITEDGGVKVVDFGIARAGSSASRLTQTATVVGTAAYLSPEQATAGAVDGRADLYAVGCVLVEMLTGAPPFDADTPVAIAFKHVNEYPVPVSVHRPDVPPALDAAVLRLLAKHPDGRPADAGSARAELLAAVPGTQPADRTGELLAAGSGTGAGAATQVLPPVPAVPYPDQQRRTSVLPPVPQQAGYAPHPQPPYEQHRPDHRDHDEQPPARSRRPLVLAGAGVAVAAVVVVAAALSLNGSTADTAGAAVPSGPVSPPAATASAAAPTPGAATTAPGRTTSPSASPSASASPSLGGRTNPAVGIAQLRAAVAQTRMPKDRDRQADLLRVLDTAALAVVGHRPDDAEDALREAQRLVKDLTKRHAVDGDTAQAWQSRLSSLIAAVHDQQQDQNG
ncbi:protein kinase [Kitasatospora sp. NPDC048540]|uniref:protein kinase domain-containing protein n=1 Tax=unclassified Kitasatospora TaxID=2633591 RepID=UPI0006919FEE|nr:protein kinase [Kitasatospora sp. MBT63]